MSERKIVRSACRMCHGVCGVLVYMEGDRVVKITGDPESPNSKGYLCPKGAASPELLYHPDRVVYPLRRTGERGDNKWKRISWDEALDEFAGKLDTIRKESGPEYLGIVQGTGRPYTELNLHFANAFATPNFTWPTHVCYFARVIASIFTMGDMPEADLFGHGGEMPRCVVSWGCNVTHTGATDGTCGGMVQRAINGAEKVIVIDPRRIGPAKKADHWLQLRPGTDGALALAMLNVVIGEDLFDRDFVENHCVGFDKLVDHVKAFTPELAGSVTGLDPDQIRTTSRTYATTKPATIVWGNGLDMNKCSFQLGRAIAILMGITGNIDRPGGNWLYARPPKVKWVLNGPYAPTQNLHLRLDANKFKINAGIHPPTFWRSIVTGDPYRLRALWIMGSNPLLNSTHSLEVEKALKIMEFTVVSDFFLTPTAQFADIVLPAATWLEQDKVAKICTKWSALARKKLVQVGEARNDNEVFIQLGRRLGLREAFPWTDLRAYLDWQLEETGMNFDEFCDKNVLVDDQPYYEYRTHGFMTPSKKFEIFCGTLQEMGVSPLPVYREPPLTPVSTPEVAKEYPLTLTTGKIRPFFHSEFRQVESLRKRNPDPLVEIHPETAQSLGVNDGDWVWMETRQSRVKMRAKLFEGIIKDVVCAQHSWWFPEAPPPEYGWKQSSLNLLMGGTEYDDSLYDPDTGAESMKSWLCRIYPV